MQRALTLDKSPPLAAPLRFILTAPWFGMLAAVLLLWQGADAFATRWAPATLALTHLITLGFLGMTMVGAVLQMLPVVTAVDVPDTPLLARVVWPALCVDTLLLACSFLYPHPAGFAFAGVLLAGALGVPCALCLWALRARVPEGARAMATGMRCALGGLAVTVLLGGALAGLFAGAWLLPPVPVTDRHAAWGLLGWVAMLVTGVSYQVIPMFQATPVYHARIERWLAPALCAGVVLWSLGGRFQPAGGTVAALALAAHGGYSLRLLAQRRRKETEATTWYWRLSFGSLLTAVAAWAAPWQGEARPLVLGVLFLGGFAMSAVSGMLYKIVPFLVWYHLQEAPGVDRRRVPKIGDLVPDRLARRQFGCHAAALLLTLAACAWPEWTARAAGLAWLLSCGALAWELTAPVWRYRRSLRPAAQPS
ncbi:MAG TPA: permease [Telluria sp.]|nr:permease [Telluria sp.]